MLSAVNGSTEKYLADLDRIQNTMDRVQREVSSGVRIGQPSDDPWALPLVAGTQAKIAGNAQAQTNLNQLKTELDTGDSALQQAVKAIDSAISVAAQGSSTLSDSQHSTLVAQVQAIQEQLVGISGTVVDGRYIFSGDFDQQPLYALDPAQPTGVRQLAAAKSTRIVMDGGGTAIWQAKTAQDIFDARNPDSSPASGNVFAAVNDLLKALQTNDDAAAQTAVSSLKAASDHLNQQLGLYGIAETRVADALNTAASSTVTEKQNLSSLRDADVASDAMQLSQATLQQQAALSARAKTSQLSLFNYLA